MQNSRMPGRRCCLTAHLNYLLYLIRHKWLVARAGLKLGVSWWRLIKHDWTKFLPCEWVAYATWFYGPTNLVGYNADAVEAAFDAAWNHHQKANDHHWQYWVLSRDDGTVTALPMPFHVILEMVADWIGAGGALGLPDTLGWYQANYAKLNLHPHTRHCVEGVLAVAQAKGLIP